MACSEAPSSDTARAAEAAEADSGSVDAGVTANPAAFSADLESGRVGKEQEPPKPKMVPKPQDTRDTRTDRGKGGLVKVPTGEGSDNPAAGKTKRPGGIRTGEQDPDAKLTIEFGREKHSFGKCRQGDLLEHTFELVSTGTNPVKIRQVSPTCGCALSGVLLVNEGAEPTEYKMGDPIEQGRKVLITAKLDTTNKHSKTNVRINVYHNDPIGLTQLNLIADIEPFLSIAPTFVNFGDIKEGESKSQIIDVRTTRGERIALKLDPSNPMKIPRGMQIDLEAVNPDEEGRAAHWRASVSIGEGASEGTMGYQLRLLSDALMPDAVIKTETARPGRRAHYSANANVNARVLGPISFSPQFLSLGLVRPGMRVPRNVKIIAHDPEFDLSNLEVELRGEQGHDLAWREHFTTSIKPASGLANAVDVQLRLEGLPEGSDGSFRGVMVIKTGDERRPELPVRFSGVCRSGVTRGTQPAKRPLRGGPDQPLRGDGKKGLSEKK